MSSIHHHPKPATLAAYAAGGLDDAMGVVIATHLSLCAECRQAVRDFEALGGVCLEGFEPAPLADDALARFWARAGVPAPETLPPSTRADNDVAVSAARPLSYYLKGGLENVRWQAVAPGIAQSPLRFKGLRKGSLRLLKIAPGVAMPKHTHQGEELTIILEGAYRDEIGAFAPGDIADLDAEETHAPVAIGEAPCICLAATSGRLAFKGVVARLMQPFVGI